MHGLQTIFDEKGFSLEQQLYILRVLFVTECFQSKQLLKDLESAGFDSTEANNINQYLSEHKPDSHHATDLLEYDCSLLLKFNMCATREQIDKTKKWLQIIISRSFTEEQFKIHQHTFKKLAESFLNQCKLPKTKEYRDVILLAETEWDAVTSLGNLRETNSLNRIKAYRYTILLCSRKKSDSDATPPYLYSLANNKKFDIFESHSPDLKQSIAEFFQEKNKKNEAMNNVRDFHLLSALQPYSAIPTLFIVQPKLLASATKLISELPQTFPNVLLQKPEMIVVHDEKNLEAFHESIHDCFREIKPEQRKDFAERSERNHLHQTGDIETNFSAAPSVSSLYSSFLYANTAYGLLANRQAIFQGAVQYASNFYQGWRKK